MKNEQSKMPRSKRRKGMMPQPGTILGPLVKGRGTITDADRIGPTLAESKYSSLSEYNKVLYLVDCVKDFFKIRIKDREVEMFRPPTADTVGRLAKELLHLWPKDWRLPDIGKSDEFSLLFAGHPTPNSVANAITRATLYADRIYVVNPFCNLFLHHPQQSPVLRPESWTQKFANSAIYVAILEPWLKADLVTMVPNPYLFSLAAVDSGKANAIAHVQKIEQKLGRDWMRQNFYESQAQMCLQLHPDDRAVFLEATLRELSEPERSAIREMVRQEMARIRENDPWQVSLPKFGPRGSAFTSNGTGLGYEHSRFLAAALSASVFTNLPSYRQELECEPAELNAPFQQAAHAFGNAKYQFLNNVRPEIAIELRGENRLSGFRSYLGSLAKGVTYKGKDESVVPTAVREFNERFEGEYQIYKKEWGDIQKKLTIHSTLSIAGTIGVSAAIATGGLSLSLLAAPLIVPATVNLVSAMFDRRKLERQPLSIIHHLDRKQ